MEKSTARRAEVPLIYLAQMPPATWAVMARNTPEAPPLVQPPLPMTSAHMASVSQQPAALPEGKVTG